MHKNKEKPFIFTPKIRSYKRMRKRFEVQYEFGATPIEEIIIPLKSRDELPPVLIALQHIFVNPVLNEKVFNIIEKRIEIKKIGKPGMSLWEILVLGVVRLTLDSNYDRLEHIANYDSLVRDLLGMKSYGLEEEKRYSLTALKENIRYLDEELLEEINEIVVKEGHRLKKKEGEEIKVKVDSYVLESNVHFPTDITLLFDSARKVISIVENLFEGNGIPGWRKSNYWGRTIKNLSRRLSQITRSGGKIKEERIKEASKEYIKSAQMISQKVKESRDELLKKSLSPTIIANLEILRYYENMLDKHIDLLERRLIKGEKIPHDEKLFSIFEPYTEWINKGKSGNKVELGLKVAVCTDQFGFVLNHRVMQKQEDVNLAVSITREIKGKYQIGSLSFDKGYWSKVNWAILKTEVKQLVMPKKGKRNKEEEERESNKKFKQLRYQHSAIESDINMLEHHGLNRCPDKGIENFRNYAALGIVAYNLHRLGNILRAEKQNEEKKLLRKAA
ncbi:MAG: ISNCY family transposase [Bacteroidetes bacterium]|nr:ISNCY family transposase [Bacteroidota bacterium]MBU2506455.1 ISNCY family transposase [Bacteroidota bacterium]